MKKIIYIFPILLLLIALGCTQFKSETHGWWKATIPVQKEIRPILETKPPNIINSFAIEKGPYGYIWKIYLEAEDPEGDMNKIAVVVEELGYGRYPTDFIILKPEYYKYLKGYLQWNTRSLSGDLPEWTQINLKLSIIDKSGNESKEINFPFIFERGVKDPYNYKLPPPFDRKDLKRIGYINIDLFPPGGMDEETTNILTN